MKHLALLLLLPSFLLSAFTQTTPHAPVRTPPPCRAITTAMLSRALVLPEACYTVNQIANVGHSLTVSAGSTITFGGSAALSIETNGSIEAVGTAEKPIVFRGRNGTAGSWSGLSLSSKTLKTASATSRSRMRAAKTAIPPRSCSRPAGSWPSTTPR